MPYYLYQVAYTPEAWAVQVKQPENRIEVIHPVIEGLGGRIEGGWLSFGDYDVVLIIHMPDNAALAAFAIAVAASGAIRTANTTPLLTISEGMDAMNRAAAAGYRPPGG
ncbi:MAG: GYD domain-containing protein [Dehalococcoidia bacterium]|nr:GYD domain-containing protein [Dehalococcoidia bacterium]